jgi:2-keto-4-pentenoate hydratase/2-oxohepta-3-ene-1,7-dioic acid hydratase in catechol pathway
MRIETICLSRPHHRVQPRTRLANLISQFMSLQPGDEVRLGIEGLGEQRQRVIAYDATS